MLPLLACALLAEAAPASRRVAARAAVLWGGAILCFLGGVRRGLSFDDPGGARGGQFAGALPDFALGLLALAAPSPRVSLAALIVGYGWLGATDRAGANAGEAPRYFARVRPAQAALAVSSFGLLLRRA